MKPNTNFSLVLIIVGERDSLRSSDILALEAELIGLGVSVLYSSPVILDPQLDFDSIQEMHRLSKHHYPRPLSLGEMGCSIAHLQAQKLALDLCADFAWILEDDAQFSAIDLAPRLCSRPEFAVQSNLPLAISLFDPWAREEFFVECDTQFKNPNLREMRGGVFPTSTLAYGMNHSALQVACSMSSGDAQFPAGKADFPIWGSAVTWFQETQDLVRTDLSGGGSLIGDREEQGSVEKGTAKILLSRAIAILKGVPDVPVPVGVRLRWEFIEYIYAANKFFQRRIGR